MSPSEWTPDQPLRADATDEQVHERRVWFQDNWHRIPRANPDLDWPDGYTAREFAAAVSAEKDTEIARLTHEVEEMRGVIETYGRVETRRWPATDRLELRFMVSADVLRAGGIGVFDAKMRECREQWHAWIKEDRERSMSVQERLARDLAHSMADDARKKRKEIHDVI